MDGPVTTPGADVTFHCRSRGRARLVIGGFYRRASGGRIFELVEVYKRNPSKNFTTTARVRYADTGAVLQIYAAEIDPTPIPPLQILSVQA